MNKPSFLEPLVFRTGAKIRNRVCLAALTNGQSQPDGILGDDELRWLSSRARGGFSIITTCAAYVADDGKGFDGQLGIASDEHLAGLTRLAENIHSEGALALAQIFHAGVRAPSRLTGKQPWSASEFDLDIPKFERPRAATPSDIENVIVAFASAAERAANAGFDGVEIHGAHGYLLTQFLGTVSNTRTDEWGGPLENRIRLVRRVIEACRVATPKNFLIGIRLSPEVADQGVDLDESMTTAKWLADDGLDFLHISNWDSFAAPKKYPDSEKPLTQWCREAIGDKTVLIATGGVWTREQALAVIKHGADIVGLGRAAIVNPQWPIDAANEEWQPTRTPVSARYLEEATIGSAFVTYLRRFKNFVEPQ